jgi:hypothetical protein
MRKRGAFQRGVNAEPRRISGSAIDYRRGSEFTRHPSSGSPSRFTFTQPGEGMVFDSLYPPRSEGAWGPQPPSLLFRAGGRGAAAPVAGSNCGALVHGAIKHSRGCRCRRGPRFGNKRHSAARLSALNGRSARANTTQQSVSRRFDVHRFRQRPLRGTHSGCAKGLILSAHPP